MIGSSPPRDSATSETGQTLNLRSVLRRTRRLWARRRRCWVARRAARNGAEMGIAVPYAIEGVFVRAGSQVLQLEVLGPEQRTTYTRTLLAAWAKRVE